MKPLYSPLRSFEAGSYRWRNERDGIPGGATAVELFQPNRFAWHTYSDFRPGTYRLKPKPNCRTCGGTGLVLYGAAKCMECFGQGVASGIL